MRILSLNGEAMFSSLACWFRVQEVQEVQEPSEPPEPDYVFPCTLATTSSLTWLGAGSYRSKCIEYVARPCVRERKSVAYPNISDSGTRALMICVPPRSSCDWIRPRRLARSPITSPR